jgi:hypothetical protein
LLSIINLTSQACRMLSNFISTLKTSLLPVESKGLLGRAGQSSKICRITPAGNYETAKSRAPGNPAGRITNGPAGATIGSKYGQTEYEAPLNASPQIKSVNALGNRLNDG